MRPMTQTVTGMAIGMLIIGVLTLRAEGLDDWSNGATAFESAMASRGDEPMPIVVYFYADWCGYCKRFNSALSEGSIDLTDFVKVRINPEKGSREQALAEKFGVRGYPSVFIIPAGSNEARKVRTAGEWDEESEDAFTQSCRRAAGL